jgi:hypothetical protein
MLCFCHHDMDNIGFPMKGNLVQSKIRIVMPLLQNPPFCSSTLEMNVLLIHLTRAE